MRDKLIRWAVGGAVVLALAASSMIVALQQGHAALVTRFGAPHRVLRAAGAHFKLPWPVERVHVFDARKRLHNTRLTETLTRDRRNVVLLTYVVWAVDDPQRFFEATGDVATAEASIDSLVTDVKNSLLGQYDLSSLVSTRAEDLKLDAIERRLLETVRRKVPRYGIAIHQVGLKRLGLPEENLRAVFEQMRQERAKEAARLRSQGSKRAMEIRAAADLRVAKTRAAALRDAEVIKGEGEAEAARIYAAAHQRDPKFYRYWRGLQSLKKVLSDRSTVILRADRPPFDVLSRRRR